MRRSLGPLILLMLLFGAGAARGVCESRIILVFPFENQSARPDLGWISESFAETLSSCLASPSNYALGREERNAALAQLNIPPLAPLLLASKYKVAEILGADWAVIGSFTVEGRRLAARAQVLDMRGRKLGPALEVTGELLELIDLQIRLAWRLRAAHDPGFTVSTEEDFRRRFPEIRLDAFENYIRGVVASDDESRVRFWREADRLSPADHRAAFELGRYYFERKDYASSAPWLEKVVEGDRDHLEALFLLGVDDFFLGKEAESERAFAALEQRVPLNEVWNNLGVMETRRGQYAEALDHFERAYRGDPSDYDFCLNLGVCLWYLKRYEEAATHLGEAALENDEDPSPHALLAVVFGKLGNLDGQRRELQWLSNHEGSSMANVTEEILPQARLKKNYEGRGFQLLSLAVSNALEESLAGGPPEQHGAVHLARGKALLADGRLAEAEREMGEAVSLLRADSEAHLALAQVYENEGRHVQAVRELDASLKLKESVSAHLWLARAYLSLDQPEAARAQSQAALQLDPGNSYATQMIDQVRSRISAPEKSP
jgi:tetratricopeptide (TPR) repeat protein